MAMHDFNIANITLDLQKKSLDKSSKMEFLQENSAHIYDFIPFPFFTFNSCGIIIEINEAGAELMAIAKDQLLQKNLAKYIIPDDQEIFAQHLQTVLKENSEQVCDLKCIRKKGHVFDAQLTSKVITNKITHEKNILSFIVDITNRQQQNASRQNSLEKFISVIAHEISHPLCIISNYLYGCIRRIEANAFHIKDILYALKRSTEQQQRITEILLKMKKIISKNDLQYEKNNLENLINEAIESVNHEINTHGIHLDLRISKKIPSVMLDKTRIKQVLIHLVRNAIEAMHDARNDNPKIIIEVNQVSKTMLEVLISDNGPGIETEKAHQLFESTFTTKSYGLGIGLPVSRSIIESHEGELIALNNANGGACFKILLPLEQSKTKAH